MSCFHLLEIRSQQLANPFPITGNLFPIIEPPAFFDGPRISLRGSVPPLVGPYEPRKLSGNGTRPLEKLRYGFLTANNLQQITCNLI